MSDSLISKVIENLPFIDSVNYLKKELSIAKPHVAKEIAIIVKKVFIVDDVPGMFGDQDEIDDDDDDGGDDNNDHNDSDFDMLGFSDFSLSEEDSFTCLDDSDFD